jgi:hypothetical protein
LFVNSGVITLKKGLEVKKRHIKPPAHRVVIATLQVELGFVRTGTEPRTLRGKTN